MSFDFDYTNYVDQLIPIFREIEKWSDDSAQNSKKLVQILKAYPKNQNKTFTKNELVVSYQKLAGTYGLAPFSQLLLAKIRMKPTRTNSGVAPITVLTKPFPCPGKCIFCPNDIRMPKSYLSDEPGAQRAERNWFDPYLQTYNRLQALYSIGHTVDKAELIILGGTWSDYPEAYQIWFVKECFRALNNFGVKDDRQVVQKKYQQAAEKLDQANYFVLTDQPLQNQRQAEKFQIDGSTMNQTYNQVVSKLYVAPEKLLGLDHFQQATWQELIKQQKINETAKCRSVGLVVETRPDNITPEEVTRIRKLGCTKVQIGFQSLNDQVLRLNHRGHDVDASRKAVKLLRQAGFKIHAHWMANLYGSNPELDKQDYLKLFDDPDFRPDELKIYPCSLIASAQLMEYYQRGEWQPYQHQELLDVVTFALTHTPEYCRLTRVIRDIPSQDIVVGNKKTNFRQIAESALYQDQQFSHDIRSREIRNRKFGVKQAKLDSLEYKTCIGKEVFFQYILPDRSILAFLRLSLPTESSFITELHNSAVIREIHVYGQVVGFADSSKKKAQHLGFGKALIDAAKSLAKINGFSRLAVISAVGTRDYYRKRGFEDGELYQFIDL